MNCLARGMGGSEMLYILCKGQTWYPVGATTKVVLEGSLPERVYPRDVIHYIPGTYGDFAGRNLEWYGDGLSTIGMDGRLTMATISAELSAEFSLFPYDDVLAEYLDGRAQWPFEPAFPDDDAEYEQTITIDLSALEPQVVLPDRVAWNTKGAREVAANVSRSTRRSSARAPTAASATSPSPPRSSRAHDRSRNADDRDAGQPGHPEGGHQARLRRDADGRGRGRDELDLRGVLRRPHGSAGRRRGVHHRIDPQLPGAHGQPAGERLHGFASHGRGVGGHRVITDPRDI